VYVASPDGSDPRNVVDMPGTERFPRWSPDGAQLLFTNDRGGDEELYVTDAEGGHHRQLTHNEVGDSAPAWSPDGERVAFSRGPVDERDLWLIDADGGHEQLLLAQPGDEWMPTWSPDGTRIVFGSGFSLRVLDFTSGATNELRVPVGGRWPTWGPTGRIAYVADGGDLWTTDGEGRDAHAVAVTTTEEFAPTWWPDGQRLVYPATRWQHRP
jgi:Tol biopolymer transport system component